MSANSQIPIQQTLSANSVHIVIFVFGNYCDLADFPASIFFCLFYLHIWVRFIPKIPRRYPEDRMTKPHEKLIYFNTFDYHTITLSHIFMCDFLLHTARLLKTYFSKNRRFLGEFRVVYNYIHSIYYIFFDRHAIRHFFLCDSVIVW